MSKPIEDYALIGDCHTAALVARDGSIDWLCEPRFDSAACFAALLGTDEHGRWRVAPDEGAVLAPAGRRVAGQAQERHQAAPIRIVRRYLDDTLILETVFETLTGTVAVVDFMPPRTDESVSHVVRIVEGRSGRVAMKSELAIRYDYGLTTPWVTRLPDDRGVRAVAGPDQITFRASVPVEGENMQSIARFVVDKGTRATFVLAYNPSHRPEPARLDARRALQRTVAYWHGWSARSHDLGPHAKLVKRSLMVLKAMTYAPTGGIVAAPTTSLPEAIGGVRNWDYRYCWLRDSTLTLFALMESGYLEEADAWRLWLARAAAGDERKLRIMYGIAGERRLEEWTVDELPGYEGSKPVRIGNEASNQLQLDVYGQLLATSYHAHCEGLVEGIDQAWARQQKALEHLEAIWRQPDQSIWETRDGPQQFTFSKVMVWLAFDSAVRQAERFDLPGPLEHLRQVRDTIHAEVCAKAFDEKRNAFVQIYGSPWLDSSLLLMPRVGFLPIDDPRIAGTVAAIERELMVDGLLLRYSTHESKDGLPPGEGAFLACSFWLVDVMQMQGRTREAHVLFDRLIGLVNDVGLLAEEYDTRRRRLVGNFPQAFSHVSLVNSALGLHREGQLLKHAGRARNAQAGRARKGAATPSRTARLRKLPKDSSPAIAHVEAADRVAAAPVARARKARAR